MLKNIIIAGLAAIVMTSVTVPGARAAGDDHSGFGSNFSDQPPEGLKDPANGTADSGAAISTIEPAAGGGSPFTATQGAATATPAVKTPAAAPPSIPSGGTDSGSDTDSAR